MSIGRPQRGGPERSQHHDNKEQQMNSVWDNIGSRNLEERGAAIFGWAVPGARWP